MPPPGGLADVASARFLHWCACCYRASGPCSPAMPPVITAIFRKSRSSLSQSAGCDSAALAEPSRFCSAITLTPQRRAKWAGSPTPRNGWLPSQSVSDRGGLRKPPESRFDFFGSYKKEGNPRIQTSPASGRDCAGRDARARPDLQNLNRATEDARYAIGISGHPIRREVPGRNGCHVTALESIAKEAHVDCCFRSQDSLYFDPRSRKKSNFEARGFRLTPQAWRFN
jgi:hypothetical protein